MLSGHSPEAWSRKDDMGRKKTKQGILSIDPFDVSLRPTQAQLSWAKWFKEITQDITSKSYHVRRIHYRTLGKLKPDGTICKIMAEIL